MINGATMAALKETFHNIGSTHAYCWLWVDWLQRLYFQVLLASLDFCHLWHSTIHILHGIQEYLLAHSPWPLSKRKQRLAFEDPCWHCDRHVYWTDHWQVYRIHPDTSPPFRTGSGPLIPGLIMLLKPGLRFWFGLSEGLDSSKS